MPRLSFSFNPSVWGCLCPRCAGTADKFGSREASRYLDARPQSCLTEEKERDAISRSQNCYSIVTATSAALLCGLKKEHKRGQCKQGQENATAVHHVAEEARHFHPTLFRDSPHHEVGTISDICVGPHEHRTDAYSHQ